MYGNTGGVYLHKSLEQDPPGSFPSSPLFALSFPPLHIPFCIISFKSNYSVQCAVCCLLKWCTYWQVLRQMFVLAAPIHTTSMRSSWSLWHSLAGLTQLFWPNSRLPPMKKSYMSSSRLSSTVRLPLMTSRLTDKSQSTQEQSCLTWTCLLEVDSIHCTLAKWFDWSCQFADGASVLTLHSGHALSIGNLRNVLMKRCHKTSA